MTQFNPFSAVDKYQNASLRDLEEHTDLMRKLQECLDAMNKLMSESDNSSLAIAKHNTDTTSHEDIRKKLDSIGDISDSSIIEKIGQHDISETSHATLRAKVNTIANQVAAMTSTINTAINNHNTSDQAHANIRAAIAEIKAQIGDLNLSNITEEIRNELNKITKELAETVRQLQTTVAAIQRTLHSHEQNITNLDNRVTQTNTKLTVIATNGSSQRTDVDEVVLRIEELKRLHDLIDAETDPDSPQNFDHNLARIITPGKSKQFKMTVKGKDNNECKFAITQIPQTATPEPKCTFSKVADIKAEELVTITANEANKAGTIFSFRVDYTDTVNNKSEFRVISILMARPFESGGISIDNWPSNVEPKHKYPVRVINLDDPGDGRFTYKMTSASDKVTFNPADASKLTQFEIIIAEDQERDVDVRCTLTVHDSMLDTDTVVSEDTHINPLPDRNTFKHTVPKLFNPKQTVNVQFYGVTSVDGTPATYKIKSKPDWLTFTPDTAIVATQNVKVKVQDDIERGTEGTIVVTSHDNNDVEFDYELKVKVNKLPSSSKITTTLPRSNVGGQQVPFTISGGEDPDDETGKTITYSIKQGNSGLVFSKLAGIKPEEEVRVTLPKVADDTEKSFEVFVVDSQGEASPDTQAVNTTITPRWVADPPRITAPTDGVEVPYEGFTVAWTEFTFHADVG